MNDCSSHELLIEPVRRAVAVPEDCLLQCLLWNRCLSLHHRVARWRVVPIWCRWEGQLRSMSGFTLTSLCLTLLATSVVSSPSLLQQRSSVGRPPLAIEPHHARGLRFPVYHATSEEQVVRRRRRALLQERADDDGDVAGSKTFSRIVPVHGTHEKMGYFYANVHIGTPAQSFGVILDTGSSIMSVPCENCSHCGTHLDPVFNVTASSTAVDTHETFSQSYTEGSSLHGTFVEDFICIGNECEKNGIERLKFKFGCANRMTNLFRTQLADGIMGMANDSKTFLSYLMEHHRVDHELFTLCLAYEGGSFGVGEYQTKNHWSPISWVPLSQNGARKKFYYIGTVTYFCEYDGVVSNAI